MEIHIASKRRIEHSSSSTSLEPMSNAKSLKQHNQSEVLAPEASAAPAASPSSAHEEVRSMEQRFATSGSCIVKATPDEWQALRAASPRAVGVDTEGVHFSPPLLVQVAYRSPLTGLVVVLLEAPVNGQLSSCLKTLLGDTAIAKAFCAADGDTDALGCPVRNIVDVQAWARTGKFGQARSKQLQGLAQLGSQFAFNGAPIKKNKKGWAFFAFIKKRPFHTSWPCLQQQHKLCAYAAADAWMTLEVYDGMLSALANVLSPPSLPSPSAHATSANSTAPPQPPQPLPPSPSLLSSNDRQRHQGGEGGGGGGAGGIARAAEATVAVQGASTAVASEKFAPFSSSTDIYVCSACGVNCNSAPNLADHKIGRKHLAVLRRLQSLPPGAAGDLLLEQQPSRAAPAASVPASAAGGGSGVVTNATTASTFAASRKAARAGKATAKLNNKPIEVGAAASAGATIKTAAAALPAAAVREPTGAHLNVPPVPLRRSNKKKARGAGKGGAPPNGT